VAATFRLGPWRSCSTRRLGIRRPHWATLADRQRSISLSTDCRESPSRVTPGRCGARQSTTLEAETKFKQGDRAARGNSVVMIRLAFGLDSLERSTIHSASSVRSLPEIGIRGARSEQVACDVLLLRIYGLTPFPASFQTKVVFVVLGAQCFRR
jgi:hypothetical protein